MDSDYRNRRKYTRPEHSNCSISSPTYDGYIILDWLPESIAVNQNTSRNLKLIRLCFQITFLALFVKNNRAVRVKSIIFERFYELGGVYIKFLQAIAMSKQITSGWSQPADLKVFEEVPVEPINITALLKHEIHDQMQLFAHIEPQPFAAGSFAQVYKGTLQTGEQVAIKILRPSIHKTLKSDLKFIGLIVQLISILKPIPMINLRELYRNFADTTLQETDYIQEARAMEWFRQNIHHKNTIVTPAVFPELSSPYVITQEFINGLPMTHVLLHAQHGGDPFCYVYSQTGSNLHQQLSVLGSELAHEVLWSDYMFGDPHAGNIRLLPDNKIGIIDFGIIVKTPTNKRAIYEIASDYHALMNDDFDPGRLLLNVIEFIDKRLAGAIRTIEQHMGKNGRLFSAISASAHRSVANPSKPGNATLPIENKRIIEIFVSLINGDNRYGITFDPHAAALVKSLNLYMQMLRRCTNGQQDQDIMKYVLSYELSFAEANKSHMASEIATQQIDLSEAVEIASEWLSQVADKDPWLFGQLNIKLGRKRYA